MVSEFLVIGGSLFIQQQNRSANYTNKSIGLLFGRWANRRIGCFDVETCERAVVESEFPAQQDLRFLVRSSASSTVVTNYNSLWRQKSETAVGIVELISNQDKRTIHRRRSEREFPDLSYDLRGLRD